MRIEDQIKDYIAKNLLFSDSGFPYDDNVSFWMKVLLISVGVMELVSFVEDDFACMLMILISHQKILTQSKKCAYIRRKTI